MAKVWPLTHNVSASYFGGGAVPQNQSVIQQGWWYIQKSLHNFTDEFRVSKSLFDGNTLTGRRLPRQLQRQRQLVAR